MAQGLTAGKKSKDSWPTAFSIHVLLLTLRTISEMLAPERTLDFI